MWGSHADRVVHRRAGPCLARAIRARCKVTTWQDALQRHANVNTRQHTDTHSHATSRQFGATCSRLDDVQHHVWVKYEWNNGKVVASVIKDWSSVHKLIIYNTALTFQHTSTDIYPDFNLYYVSNQLLFSLSMNLPIVFTNSPPREAKKAHINVFKLLFLSN